MVASINNKTNEIKLVSVYRDTLMKVTSEKYGKANSAYNSGGPTDAIALLNRNLDLDIEKYISVNFNALADVVDALGGIEIDMTEEEVYWTNGYCTETSKVVGRETAELSGAGVHKLDGVHAVPMPGFVIQKVWILNVHKGSESYWKKLLKKHKRQM